jgi:hypothetical protein
MSMISIFAKSLSGELFELENIYSNSSVTEIATYLENCYPAHFLKETTCVMKDTESLANGDVVSVVCNPQKIVAAKKMFTRDNSMCLHIGVKLFDCIQNVHFYEEGEEVDVDIDHLSTIYERIYKGTTINKMGIDSNRLNIMKKNETSSDYMCSMGNHGSISKGTDLKSVLSGVFEQAICHIGLNEEGIPFYKMKFQFKPYVIEQIVSITSTYLK